MKTITQTFTATYEVKHSKFIAYLTPIENFKSLREELKANNPKANHIVYALRNLNEFEQIVENSSDDGEPKGSSGVPALNVLRGKELINVSLLIVRYFGGIKLGIGGLARAYGNATKMVVDACELVEYIKEINYKFSTPYNQIDKTLHTLRGLGIDKYNRDFGIDGVEWIITTTQEKIDKLQITNR
ncbi:FIG000605: protein co-occurring with transport systems (COG1739) [hydrothermal vent metagenome]|uniref:FIG000605: protein co-occurring with transport systems (COG1739) n=1 Tax=hydrothermal vent metagenome TaxID=652676 RepID=A0A1W1ELL1_9ZZZZ